MDSITLENSKEWTTPEYWKALLECNFDISECASKDDSQSGKPSLSPSPVCKYRDQLRERGFCLVNESFDDAIIQNVRLGIEKLHELALPATFIFLFDVAWDLGKLARKVLQEASDYPFHTDVLAWYIDDTGFSPHRDRQPDQTASSFDESGNAKFVTLWIAVTDATPANSCLYMIPKSIDPGNMQEDQDDPLTTAMKDKQSYQHIRAIPRQSGQSVLFTHRVLHWGSAREADAPPRIAISFVASAPDFEAPYVDLINTDRPPFRERLLLVCAQLLIYYQRFEFPTHALQACFRYCQQNELDDAYRRKVSLEFVKAMKERGWQDDDAVMDAMLENEQAFSDDFL